MASFKEVFFVYWQQPREQSAFLLTCKWTGIFVHSATHLYNMFGVALI